MRTTLLCTFVLVCGAPAALAQGDPPPVIRVYVEQVKPGKNAAHGKAESNIARDFAKANYPAHYIALNAMSGANEAWFVEAHASFADVEKSEKASDAPALKATMDQAMATDGEYLSGMRSLIAVYRKDLSHEPANSPRMPKTRYMNVITFRFKMGSEQQLAANLKEMVKIYSSAQLQQPALLYQVISGAPGGTYLLFEPIVSLAEWDNYPAMMLALRTAGGRKFDALQKELTDITVFHEGRLMSIDPKMSYVSKEFAAVDPDFWTPKPKPAAKPASKSGAAKQTGQ
jgi:hypothetical protein